MRSKAYRVGLRWSAASVGVAAILVLSASAALADVINADGDTGVASRNLNYGTDLPCASLGTIVDGSITLSYDGQAHYAAGETLNVTLTADPGISATADQATVPAGWGSATTSYTFGIHTTVSTGVSGTGHQVDVTVTGATSSYTAGTSSGHGTPQFIVNVDSSCGTPVPTNDPPSVGADHASMTVDEGSTATNTGTYSDPDGDPVTISASVGSISKTGTSTGTWSWSWGTTDGPADSQTVTISADDGQGHQPTTAFGLTVDNVKPVVAAPSFSPASIPCRTSTNLTGISFGDPGTIDYPWAVDISWGDGSLHTTYNTNTQGAQSNQPHQYNTPGSYGATVGVTDKDLGYESNTSSSNVTVTQVYNVDFLPPFDDSTPSQLIVNTMKAGRTVPVKMTIYDVCTQSYVTSGTVTINMPTAAGTGGATFDAVENYADAGASSANTKAFRWSSDASIPGGGFWIYNLDSRLAPLGPGTGAPMTVNQLYRVNAYLNNTLVTTTDWALLKAVK